VAAGGEQGAGHLQVAAQGRVGGVDPLDLVHQQPAGGELVAQAAGAAAGSVRWLEQEPAEQQAGRAAGRERDAPHVVDGEGDPGPGPRPPGPGDERDRLVEAEGASRTQDRGEQAGGVAGSAA
jgi:hypothetical protein